MPYFEFGQPGKGWSERRQVLFLGQRIRHAFGHGQRPELVLLRQIRLDVLGITALEGREVVAEELLLVRGSVELNHLDCAGFRVRAAGVV